MDIATKIRLAAKYAGISEAELARRFGITPQNLSQRFKVDKFTTAEIEKMAEAMGAKFDYGFVFEDGTRI